MDRRPWMRMVEERVNDLYEALVQEWAGAQGCPPDHLYHYTSADGLKGILTSRTLWATDIYYMNDATELLYGRDVCRDVIHSYLGILGPRSERMLPVSDDELFRLFLVQLEADLEDPSPFYNLCTACFCTEPDLLSQWRGYGASGGGYAIGFHTAGLTERERFFPNRFRLLKVVYSRGTQEQHISHVLDAYHHKLIELAHESVRSSLDQAKELASTLASAAASSITYYIMTFKDGAFAEEQEWRIVGTQGKDWRDHRAEVDTHFRIANGAFIPYSPIPFQITERASLLPSRIVVGPTHLGNLAIASLERWLQANGYPNVEVARSRVPLRA